MRRFLLLVCLVFASLSALAQAVPPAPKMTWIRYYHVERGKDADFMGIVQDAFRPVLDDLQKRQKVVAWGVAIPITMNGEPWTHALYMAMPDWSGAEALDQAIDKAQASMTPAAAKSMAQRSMAIVDSRDVILRHIVQSPPPKGPSKYILVDTYKIKSGRDGDAVQLFNEWGTPLFTDLTAKGKVDMWGLSTHGVPGAADWTHMVWTFLHDLGDLEAIIAANESMEPRKMQGYAVRLRDMSEWSTPHEQIWRITAP